MKFLGFVFFIGFFVLEVEASNKLGNSPEEITAARAHRVFHNANDEGDSSAVTHTGHSRAVEYPGYYRAFEKQELNRETKKYRALSNEKTKEAVMGGLTMAGGIGLLIAGLAKAPVILSVAAYSMSFLAFLGLYITYKNKLNDTPGTLLMYLAFIAGLFSAFNPFLTGVVFFGLAALVGFLWAMNSVEKAVNHRIRANKLQKEAESIKV